MSDETAKETDGDLITSGQVAALFGVDVGRVADWADTGRLPVASRTRGGHRRYRRPEAEALAEAWRAYRNWPATAVIAEVLRVSQDTVTRWARDGRLPGAVQGIDGHWRMPPATLRVLIVGSALVLLCRCLAGQPAALAPAAARQFLEAFRERQRLEAEARAAHEPGCLCDDPACPAPRTPLSDFTPN